MTVLLVLFTLTLFLIVDHVVQKRRAHAVAVLSQVGDRMDLHMQFPIRLPDGLSLATNHTWMKGNQDGTITIGIDEFLSRLVGTVKTISIPQAGEAMVSVATDIAVGTHGRSIRLASPTAGRVIESNAEVLKDPSLVLSDPYGKGWLMRIKSETEDLAASRQYIVRRPIEWLKEQTALVRDFIAVNTRQGQPAMLQEGGLPVEGVLQQFDEHVWQDFGRAFTVLQRTHEHKEIRK